MPGSEGQLRAAPGFCQLKPKQASSWPAADPEASAGMGSPYPQAQGSTGCKAAPKHPQPHSTRDRAHVHKGQGEPLLHLAGGSPTPREGKYSAKPKVTAHNTPKRDGGWRCQRPSTSQKVLAGGPAGAWVLGRGEHRGERAARDQRACVRQVFISWKPAKRSPLLTPLTRAAAGRTTTF